MAVLVASFSLSLPVSVVSGASQAFTHSDTLANAAQQTIAGTKTSDGCSWSMPALELSETQTVVESRQVSADWDTCTSVIETGVPSTSRMSRSPLNFGGGPGV